MNCVFKNIKNGDIFYKDVPSFLKENFCIDNGVILLFTSCNAIECIEYMNSYKAIQKTSALKMKNI